MIHNQEFNTKSYIPKSLLSTTIFSPVQKNNFNNTVKYSYKDSNYKIEVKGYQPNLDIDFKLFCIFIRDNKQVVEMDIDDVIKQSGHKGRIQKRDRDRILNSIERMMQTHIKIETKKDVLLVNLISYSHYNSENKKIKINFSNILNLYKAENFFRFISVNDINKLNQYESAIYLLLNSQVNKLVISEKKLMNRIFYNTNSDDKYKKYHIKKSLESLKEKKLIKEFSINENNIYTIIRLKSVKELEYKILKEHGAIEESKKQNPIKPNAITIKEIGNILPF